MLNRKVPTGIASATILGLVVSMVLVSSPASADTGTPSPEPIAIQSELAEAAVEEPIVEEIVLEEPAEAVAPVEEVAEAIDEAPVASVKDPTEEAPVEAIEVAPVEEQSLADPVEAAPVTETPDPVDESAPVVMAPAIAATDPNRPAPGESGYTLCWERYSHLTTLDPYDARTWPDFATCAPLRDTLTTSVTTASRNRPTEGQPGYTSCWTSEVNRTDVGHIDPYDMRTWPMYVTPSEAQPGYTPHIGAPSEGSDIWTQVGASDPRLSGTDENGFYWDSHSPDCYPVPTSPTHTASAEVLGTSDQVLAVASPEEPVNVPTKSGSAIKVRSTFVVNFPEVQSIIDRNGYLTSNWFQGDSSFRFSAPQVNQNVGSPAGDDHGVWPDDVASSCDVNDRLYNRGESVTVTCITTGVTPEITFDEYRHSVYEAFGNGVTVPLATELGYESRYVDPLRPELTGAWSEGVLMQPGFTAYSVGPTHTWLPTAQDKKYRVKASETLTVTPDGLLTGASWSQGSVESLDTYITNVPTGGTLTDHGSLEFTSEQVGDYAFNYYLEDPETELRSAAATGTIEVYSEAVITPPIEVTPTPPVSITPVATTPEVQSVPTADRLAYTGSDGLGVPVLVALFLLLAGLGLTRIRQTRHRAERSVQS